jgi:hypothetical protein
VGTTDVGWRLARCAGGVEAREAGGRLARCAGGVEAREADGRLARCAGGVEAREAGGRLARCAGGVMAREAGRRRRLEKWRLAAGGLGLGFRPTALRAATVPLCVLRCVTA